MAEEKQKITDVKVGTIEELTTTDEVMNEFAESNEEEVPEEEVEDGETEEEEEGGEVEEVEEGEETEEEEGSDDTEVDDAEVHEDEPPDVEEFVKEKVGLTLDEIEALKKEVEMLREQEPPEPEFKDDFIKEAVKYYEETGSLAPYLEAHSVDFEKMDGEELVRYKLRQENPGLSDSQFNRYFQKHLKREYGIEEIPADLEDDERREFEADVELGKARMENDARKYRSEFIDRQKKFKAPERKGEETSAEDYDKAARAATSYVQQAEPTKALLGDKKLRFGDFEFEVKNVESLVQQAGDAFLLNQLSNEGEELNLDQWYKVAAIASDLDGFLKSHANHWKSQGKKAIITKSKNPQNPLVKATPPKKAGKVTDVRVVHPV